MDILDVINKKFENPKIIGSQAQVVCPFHEDHYPGHLYIDLTRGLWHCFHASCLQSGNIYSLVKRLNLPGKVTFDIEYRKKEYDIAEVTTLPDYVIAPYSNYYPTQLLEQGFSQKVLDLKEVGVDTEEYRITFPIRDKEGKLVGLAGRHILEIGETGRYKFYSYEMQKIIPGYNFYKSHHLYNIDLVYPSLYFDNTQKEIIIVEGFKACLWMIDNGFPNTVALMGAFLSKIQEEKLSQLTNRFILFLDNEESGDRSLDIIATRLSTRGIVYVLPMFKRQPDQYSTEELKQLMSNKQVYTPNWREIINDTKRKLWSNDYANLGTG